MFVDHSSHTSDLTLKTRKGIFAKKRKEPMWTLEAVDHLVEVIGSTVIFVIFIYFMLKD